MSEYSIVITTFDKRFKECLVPLVGAIKLQRPSIEIIVMVNGRARDQFNESYRSELLSFLGTQKNCFPTIFLLPKCGIEAFLMLVMIMFLF